MKEDKPGGRNKKLLPKTELYLIAAPSNSLPSSEQESPPTTGPLQTATAPSTSLPSSEQDSPPTVGQLQIYRPSDQCIDSGYSDDGEEDEVSLSNEPQTSRCLYGIEGIGGLIMELLGGHLHLAPIRKDPSAIYCIGADFGEYANDIGTRYPGAVVTAVDKRPLEWCVPNVAFYEDKIEEDWPLEDDTQDLVHVGLMMQYLGSLAHLLKEAFRVLKPDGSVEFLELENVQYKHSEVLKNYYFDYTESLYHFLWRSGRDVDAIYKLEAELHQAGFVYIQHEIIHIPIGYWPGEPRWGDISARIKEQAKLAVGEIGRLVMKSRDRELRLALARNDLERSAESYFRLHRFAAQKPASRR
ncbi:hypothetical protein IFR05_015649 [Cadophora sp. M221]|nr:hypothetical protein IFR05_015649 [Cadophora sp. M221]